MAMQVDASTVSAGAFLSESKLYVPDYQRRYSWSPRTQIDDFWSDLAGAVEDGEYFLGLIILADAPNRQEIVDGQQRLVTLTILANVLRLTALRHGRRLVAESLRTDFLWAMNFETEAQVSRLKLTDEADSDHLRALLRADSLEEVIPEANSPIYDAHIRISSLLEEDLARHDNAALRVGQWSEFITKRVTFAVFRHPDRSAAFRVFEVINTRGKVLTPTELIKSFLIGTNSGDRDETYKRWSEIEDQLDAVGGLDQLTTYVRHVVTLDAGYVIPRELYAVVTRRYSGAAGVRSLLASLELHLPTYLLLLDPSADLESSDPQMRAFVLADTLSLTRFRPILLAASREERADQLFSQILDIVVPGVLAGAFGTGSIEAQFARAARRLHNGSSWEAELLKLRDLRPTEQEFDLRMMRGLSKFQAHVLRSAYLQRSSMPALDGYPHLVRPANGTEWVDFEDDDFASVGTTIGNWVLTDMERRPPGARTPVAVAQKILTRLIDSEERLPELATWTAEEVEARSSAIVREVSGLWYGR